MIKLLGTIFYISLRNLWRNKVRTLLTFIVIFVGTFLIMFSNGMVHGFHSNLLKATLNLKAGYVVLQDPNYIKTPGVSHYITNVDQREKTLQTIPHVTGFNNIILGDGMLQSGFNTLAVSVQGIVPSHEKQIKSATFTKIISGNYLHDGDINGIVLGKKLAKKLKVKMGNKVVMLVSDSKGNLNQILLYVRGIFETGADSTDNSLVQLTLQGSRTLYNMPPNSLTRIGVMIDRAINLPVVLQKAKAQNKDVAVLPWETVLPTTATFLELDSIINDIILIFFGLIILGLVYNTIAMSVVERRREYQLSISVGTPLYFIRLSIFFETLVLITTAVILGGIGSVIFNAWTAAVHGVVIFPQAANMSIGAVTINPSIIFVMSKMDYFWIIMPMIVATLLLSLMPIMRSTNIDLTERN